MKVVPARKNWIPKETAPTVCTVPDSGVPALSVGTVFELVNYVDVPIPCLMAHK